ncbi:cyanobactin biosynthesis system PatB/AcyB/McaB family protein [Myxosarcina sp. GI1(2024)]
MRLPKLAPPVKRPDLIFPHRAVDIVNGRGEDLIHIRMDLMHGANFNDPPQFRYPSFQRIMSSCWDYR